MGRPATRLSSAGLCWGAKHEQLPLGGGGEHTWSLPYCSLSEGDRSDLGTCWAGPLSAAGGSPTCSGSSGRDSLTQDRAWLKPPAKQSPVLVTGTDGMGFEEHLINANISRKAQRAADTVMLIELQIGIADTQGMLVPI